jgi:hypothetical protein
MKSTEINLKKDGYNFNCNTYPARSHYKFIMSLGRALPSTKAQAKFFLKEGINIGVLNSKDVETIEALLNKHGFEGKYKYTKSKTWVRLINQQDLQDALRREYIL